MQTGTEKQQQRSIGLFFDLLGMADFSVFILLSVVLWQTETRHAMHAVFLILLHFSVLSVRNAVFLFEGTKEC